MGKNSPRAEAVVETGLETVPDKSEAINFAEPISASDQVAAVADSPQEQLLSEAQMAALHAEANRDNTKRDFTLNVLAARAKNDEPPPEPPKVADGVRAQTLAEMEAGRKMNDHHAALQVHRAPTPKPEHGEKTTAVFRPGDYVPDQKKGQGNIQARNL